MQLFSLGTPYNIFLSKLAFSTSTEKAEADCVTNTNLIKDCSRIGWEYVCYILHVYFPQSYS